MIKIYITRNSEDIVKVEIKGHANYAEYGQDIVCSAISTLAQTAGASIDNMQVGCTYIADGHYVIDVSTLDSKFHHDAQVLLKALVLGCDTIRNQYPKNIKMEEKVL